MAKRALITGIRGQDGAYLARHLLDRGYEVYGGDRRSGEATSWRLKELGVHEDVERVYLDLFELTNIIRVLREVRPDEIYNLAAQSFVGVSFEQPILTSEVNAIGVLRLLEAIRTVDPDIRFYQASSSEMFGDVREIPQRTSTPFYPRSPYGISKVFGHWATVNYREAYDFFACSGILYNHESPLRGEEFVTRKIANRVARIAHGFDEPLVLGNLNAKRDWGYAAEYVDAMWRMLQMDEPGTYTISTGETHSVRDFVDRAFEVVDHEVVWHGEGVEARGYDRASGRLLVEVSEEFYRPADVELLVGDPEEAGQALGWEPKVRFSRLVELMVEAELERVAESEQIPV